MNASGGVPQFWNLLQGVGTCMLVTFDGGVLRARPMRPLADAARGEVQFLTSRKSHKIQEISQDCAVNLSFVDARAGQYVSISGSANSTQDRAAIRRVWDGDADLWFADGPDSDDVMLIRVVPSRAEVWERETNTLKAYWEKNKALGSTEQPNLGTDRKLDL